MNHSLSFVALAGLLLFQNPALAKENAPRGPADTVLASTAQNAATGEDAEAAPATTELVPESADEIRLTFAPLVRATAPAVVNVYAARAVPSRSPFAGDPFFEQFFGRGFEARPRMESSLGSGVVVDASGLIVTNNHVIDGADEIRVALADGRELTSTVLLKDAGIDLAILKIESEEPLAYVPIGDSDGAQIGDLVLAIGNPFGIGQTVTSGIVSALARTHVGISDFGFFIQTDAAINPGNSGGALIDMQGRLVGVNTAIFSRSGGSNGIGFAIPSNMVRVFVDAARDGGSFERPYIGATFTEVTADIAEALGLPTPRGALVESVDADGALSAAGVGPGDVVLAMGSFPITGPDALGYRLATTGIGNRAELRILSGGQERSVQIALVAAPEVPARDERRLASGSPFDGALVANLSPKLAGEIDMPPTRSGVVVLDVPRGSPAARFGLRPRDIVLSLNASVIEDTATLESALRSQNRGWRFEIERDGRRLVQAVR